MKREDERYFSLWAETAQYKRAEDEARTITNNNIHGKPYLAFSGGKDSTVMLHLALQYKPDIPVYLYDFGEKMPRSLFNETIEIAKSMGVDKVNIMERHTFQLQDLMKIHIPKLSKIYDKA